MPLAQRAQGLDGFIIPRADEFQGEYVPARSERLSWLTGFTGSAGACVAMLDKAAVFVDGRYAVQVVEQVDTTAFAIESLIDNPPHKWLEANLQAGMRFGFDPWMHAVTAAEQLDAAAKAAGAELVAVTSNPLDEAWDDQPAAPLGAVTAHAIEYAGEDSASKRTRIAAAIASQGAAAAIISMPESIAWLLNVRGADVPHTPFPLSYAVLDKDGHVTWFIDRRKLTPGIEAWIGNAVTIQAFDQLGAHLDGLGHAKTKVLADPSTVSYWMYQRLNQAGAKIIRAADPISLPKACKNPTELQGFRNAHQRDGVAITRFLHWLDQEAPHGSVDEIHACRKLEAFRLDNGALKDLSFDTISASGPNAALPHYRVSATSNRKLGKDEIFLVDSGGQYLDGTTDITRTVIIGTPTAEMRDRFTRVLRGHIALALARFPDGTAGVHLDALARAPLWDGGFDFDHGTGHGVGSYLSVHEGPQNISKRMIAVPLKPGMVCSNEPGYYKQGQYGIRIENLIAVTAPTDIPGGERSMMSFETLTYAPIDRRLIAVEMLTAQERSWLNAYHARVLDVIGPHLDGNVRAWAAAACAPL